MANPKTETLTRTLRGSLIQKEGPASQKHANFTTA